MKTIKFTKMSGAGNDFIMLGPEYASLKVWARGGARYLCKRRLSVGADGLIIVENSTDGIFMHYYNSDGTKPAFCGNGARCVVRFCDSNGIASSPVTFHSRAGQHTGEIKENYDVRLSVAPPTLVDKTEITIDGATYAITLVDAGVPHAVVFVDDIDAIDVEGLGRKIRNHPAFGKDGANADFVAAADRGKFAIRTYERGVERETLACGSGCVAAGLVLRQRQMAGDQVRLKVRSGGELMAEFPGRASGKVFLTGSAYIVYEGETRIQEDGPDAKFIS